MSSPIVFGTDGWRAILGQDFIPQNVSLLIQSFCNWRHQIAPDKKLIVLGYDRRDQSLETARLVSEILAGNGFRVLLSDKFCPTPCVSWVVKSTDAFVGIMVTASHNPWNWNGIKFKEEYGGSASPAYTKNVEEGIPQVKEIKKIPFDQAVSQGAVEFFNPHDLYVKHLQKLTGAPVIAQSGLKILYDSMHGAGSGYVSKIINAPLTEIRSEPFHASSTNPEPIEKNLSDLISRMKTGEFDIGLATDGDADRIAAIDKEGVYVNPHQIFALLLQHYVEDKGLKGAVVKSLSTTQMIDRLCQKYDLELIETPVGFKYICEKLVGLSNPLMGGEESGGISFAPHVHERDGLLNGLMLAEMMSVRKKSFRQLLEDLNALVGTFYYKRLDNHVEHEKISAMRKKLANYTPQVEGLTLVSINKSDGFKYTFSDGSWLLLRSSGTEPLVRIYVESSSVKVMEQLLSLGQSFL